MNHPALKGIDRLSERQLRAGIAGIMASDCPCCVLTRAWCADTIAEMDVEFRAEIKSAGPANNRLQATRNMCHIEPAKGS